jgi:hypothetical protein
MTKLYVYKYYKILRLLIRDEFYQYIFNWLRYKIFVFFEVFHAIAGDFL